MRRCKPVGAMVAIVVKPTRRRAFTKPAHARAIIVTAPSECDDDETPLMAVSRINTHSETPCDSTNAQTPRLSCSRRAFSSHSQLASPMQQRVRWRPTRQMLHERRQTPRRTMQLTTWETKAKDSTA